MSKAIKESTISIDRQRQRFLQAKLINHIAQVYFFFAEENEDFENETDIDEFIEFMWDIAIMTAASLGMKVVGETSDGKIITELKPAESVKQFLLDSGIGEKDDNYLEDIEEDEYKDENQEKIAQIDWAEWSEIFE